MRYPFYPRKKIKCYLVQRKPKRQLVLKRGAYIYGWHWRNKPSYEKNTSVIETYATLDPPIRKGQPRFYFTVKYSGRDWDWDELILSKEVAIAWRAHYNFGNREYKKHFE